MEKNNLYLKFDYLAVNKVTGTKLVGIKNTKIKFMVTTFFTEMKYKLQNQKVCFFSPGQ